MTRQLPLAIDLADPPELAGFISTGNEAACAALACLAAGDEPRQIHLFGPPGSGKSHLLQGVCAEVARHGGRALLLPLGRHDALEPRLLDELQGIDLVAIDDLDRVAGDAAWERGLFHLFNELQARSGGWLWSSGTPLDGCTIALDDLHSRLAWGARFRLSPLDDAGRVRLLRAAANRRGIELPEASALYLVHHQPRNPSDLKRLLERLDRASLAAQRRLTIPFIRAVLDASDTEEA